MARSMTASASGSPCQQSATTRTSVMGRANSAIGLEFLLRGEFAPCALAAEDFRIKAFWLPAAAAILRKRRRSEPPVHGGSRLRPRVLLAQCPRVRRAALLRAPD